MKIEDLFTEEQKKQLRQATVQTTPGPMPDYAKARVWDLPEEAKLASKKQILDSYLDKIGAHSVPEKQVETNRNNPRTRSTGELEAAYDYFDLEVRHVTGETPVMISAQEIADIYPILPPNSPAIEHKDPNDTEA